MEVIDEETVFFDRFPFGVAPHEFLVESVSLCGFVIGRSDIFDSYRFGTVHMAYPVGIGQIDTDGGRGIAIAGENGSRDDFGRYAFDLFFLECGIGGGVVFEPLGIGADDFGAVGGVEVFEIYDRFPTAFQSDRVAIHFYESVYKVDTGIEVGYPLYRVFVKCL